MSSTGLHWLITETNDKFGKDDVDVNFQLLNICVVCNFLTSNFTGYGIKTNWVRWAVNTCVYLKEM